jgi:hypothetical protein
MQKYTFKKNRIRLPKQIVEDIEKLNLSEINKSHVTKFISLLMNHSFQKYGDIFSFTSKSQLYLEKVFSDHYYKWLKVLLENQIILRTERYHKGLSYYYSINPTYNFTLYKHTPTILCTETFRNQLINRVFKEKIYPVQSNEIELRNWFIKDFESLEINFDNLYEIIERRVNNLSIESLDYKIGFQYSNRSCKVNGIGNNYYSKKYMRVSKIEKICKETNYQVIQTPEGCYLDDLEHFLNKKKYSIYLSYINTVDSLKEKFYRVGRNDTNNRLDTNLTNLYSEMVDEICRQNNLIQIDLSNSQFCFLSQLLKKELNTPDSQLFQILSISGSLYSYVSDRLEIGDYKKTKRLMFSLLFSSNLFKSAEKNKLMELFPTVINWIDDFKRNNGYKSFSIELQKLESNFFIDNLLKRIKKQGLFCLTKHDSLIIRRHDYEPIVNIINRISTEFGYDGVYKEDSPTQFIRVVRMGSLNTIPFRFSKYQSENLNNLRF